MIVTRIRENERAACCYLLAGGKSPGWWWRYSRVLFGWLVKGKEIGFFESRAFLVAASVYSNKWWMRILRRGGTRGGALVLLLVWRFFYSYNLWLSQGFSIFKSRVYSVLLLEYKVTYKNYQIKVKERFALFYMQIWYCKHFYIRINMYFIRK